jgi:hypothetical protein
MGSLMSMHWPIYVTCLMVAACSRPEPHGVLPTNPEPTSAEDASPQSSARTATNADAGPSIVDVRHSCTTDADCTLSCKHGAVNRAWYRSSLPGGEDCEDGCASKGMTAKCETGRCSAQKGGSLVPECTGLILMVDAVGPYHRCTKRSDCVMTCKYGAVNKSRAASLADDCDDGCERATADCQHDVCVALNGTKVEPACTQVSIWK